MEKPVDESTSAPGTVVLRGMPISLDTDVGEAFIIDCARHTEGLLSYADVKSKWALSDAEWAALERNTPLLAHVRREREQRVTNGTAAIEAANRQFAKAPSILGTILSNDEMPPRHRIEAARELRAIAAGSLNDKRKPSEKLVVVINLGAGEGIRFEKELGGNLFHGSDAEQ